MLERCNVSFRNANEQAASARSAIKEAYDRRVFRRTRSHLELIRLSRTVTDVHRLWGGGWALSAGNISMTRTQARVFSVDVEPPKHLPLLACAMRGHLHHLIRDHFSFAR
jgi:hypothetical protein